MIPQVERIRHARRIYVRREGALGAGDRWFSLYLIVFIAGFYILPISYVIGEFLDPGFASSMTAPLTAPYAAALLSLCGALSLWIGRKVQGPVFLTPFLAHTLLNTELSRRMILSAPTLLSLLGTALVLTGITAIGLFALTQTGVWGWERFGLLVLATTLGGLHLGLLAFLGQRLTTSWTITLTLGLLLGGVLSVIAPFTMSFTPAGWAAALWAGESAWPVAFMTVTATAGLVLLVTMPSALGRMPSRQILEQCRRIADARMFTSTGNINDTVALFQSRPRHRAQGLGVGSGHLILSGLRQDLVAAARSPVSLATAAILISSGAALLTWVTPAIGAELDQSRLLVTVPVGALGGLLLFFGTGTVTEGWRQVKNEYDTSALFGWSSGQAFLRRLLWPLAITGGCTTMSAGSIVLGSDLGLSPLWWVLSFAVLTLCARFFQSMRSRDIPVEFLAPTVIPGGVDLSAVKILMWLGDGVLLTVTAVLAVLILPLSVPALVFTLVIAAMVAVVWGWARTGQQLLARSPRRYG